MKYRLKIGHSMLCLTASLLVLTACGKGSAPDAAESKETTVATVNGKPISAATFDLYVTTVTRQPLDAVPAEQKTQLLDQFVGMQLAADAAEKAGLDKNKEVTSQLALSKLNVLADARFKKYLDEHPISDAEIKSEYDEQVAHMPREYHARHILVESKTAAESLIRELKSGGDFAKLAEKESKDPSGKNGGDLGWFTPDTMVKPFADALLTLEKGQTTQEPVQSQFGWHVIRLEDSRVPAPPEFDQVKDRVKVLVQRKKLQAFIDELRKGAKIEKKS
jgi:peptidyl-prolyl cis-trans isomerase C